MNVAPRQNSKPVKNNPIVKRYVLARKKLEQSLGGSPKEQFIAERRLKKAEKDLARYKRNRGGAFQPG